MSGEGTGGPACAPRSSPAADYQWCAAGAAMGRVPVTSSHTHTHSGTGRAPPVCSTDNEIKMQTGNTDLQGFSY